MNNDSAKTALLSVVIIGLNEAEKIVACINSIKDAVSNIPETAIVYVDSGSSDGTVKLALDTGIKVFQLGTSQPPSPAAGRYVGSLVTKSKYIMFVDGDSVVASGWVKPAIRTMEQDSSIVMLAGQLLPKAEANSNCLVKVNDLGQLKEARTIGGGRAPIILREALVKAGNWNPFVISMEEEDLAIRLRYYLPGARVMQSEQYTVCSPIYPYSPKEFLRRCKRGFLKGRGQVLKNSINGGYWRQCLRMTKSSQLFIVLIVGLTISIPLDAWWWFLLCFYAVVGLRALLTRKYIRLLSVFYSILTGAYCLWEFSTVPVRTSKDYICDYNELNYDSYLWNSAEKLGGSL